MPCVFSPIHICNSATHTKAHNMVLWCCCIPCPSPRETITGVVTAINDDYTCEVTPTATFEDSPRCGDTTVFKFWRFLHQDGVYPRLVKMTPELKERIEQNLLGAVVLIKIRVDDESMTGTGKIRTAVKVDPFTQEKLERVRVLVEAAGRNPQCCSFVAEEGEEEASAPPIAVPVVKMYGGH